MKQVQPRYWPQVRRVVWDEIPTQEKCGGMDSQRKVYVSYVENMTEVSIMRGVNILWW